MKKLYILPATLVCAFALFFVGCGDDEDETSSSAGGCDGCVTTYCGCIGDGTDPAAIANCAQAAATCIATNTCTDAIDPTSCN